MLLGESLVQQGISHRSRERNIDNPTRMHMSDFGTSKPEFAPAKTVGVSPHLRPGQNLRLDFKYEFHLKPRFNHDFDAPRC